MDKLPYQEGTYESFLDFVGHLVDYIEGKPNGLRRYSSHPEDWQGSPYQHRMTPEKALQELNAGEGNYDAWIDVVKKPSGIQSHIINVTTEVEGETYIFTYDLSLPVGEANGIHFFKQDESDGA